MLNADSKCKGSYTFWQTKCPYFHWLFCPVILFSLTKNNNVLQIGLWTFLLPSISTHFGGVILELLQFYPQNYIREETP